MLVLYIQNSKKDYLDNPERIFVFIFLASMVINLLMGFCLLFAFDNEIDYP